MNKHPYLEAQRWFKKLCDENVVNHDFASRSWLTVLTKEYIATYNDLELYTGFSEYEVDFNKYYLAILRDSIVATAIAVLGYKVETVERDDRPNAYLFVLEDYSKVGDLV